MIPPVNMSGAGGSGLPGGDLGSMLSGARKRKGGTKEATKELAAIAGRLSAEDRDTLLKFAQFLEARDPAPAAPEPLPEPEPIPRPQEESVIKAMRRLSATYFMLDRARLLNETSALMAKHVMQGHSAVEVIDQLEEVFDAHYQKARAENAEQRGAAGSEEPVASPDPGAGQDAGNDVR